MNHDLDLLADAKGVKKVFDADGNFNSKWYEERLKCYDFYNHKGNKEYRMFIYSDGSYQMSYLGKREPLLGGW